MKRFILLLAALPCFAAAQIQYTLTPDPASKSVRVTVTAASNEDQITYRMPAWVPGFYVILQNQKKVSMARAVDSAGKGLTILPQTDPHVWVVKNPGHSRVTFSYNVLGDDPGLGFFAVNVRPNTAFVNGAAAFMYLGGRKNEPTTLKINLPEGWDVGTSMNRRPDGVYVARDYDELEDHPIDMGKFVKRTFMSQGIPFEVDYVTLDELYPADKADQIASRLQKLVVPAIQMFNGAPFKRYVFHLHFGVGNFSGGLEHQASVTIAIGPQTPVDRVDDLYTHEFFHAWNVKNIRPKVLGPFDYTKEVRTDNLWWAEGVTDYYAKLHAYRSGLNSANGYLFPALQGEVRQLQGGQTRHSKTVAEASQLAWEGGSQGTGDLSYYNKGQLVGWILDAAIRTGTHGAKSLDDVFRYMYSRYHLPDKPGYEENGILEAVNTVSGLDLTDLYNKMVYSTDELPYDLLEGIGIRVIAPQKEYQGLGFSTDASGNVTDVVEAVRDQGLQTGDRIITLNGKPISAGAFGLTPDGYVLNIRRGGEAMRIELKPVTLEAENYVVEANPFATEEQARYLQDWLKRPAAVK